MKPETVMPPETPAEAESGGVVRCSDLLCGDCLELMRKMPDASVSCTITDPPFGVTGMQWDKTPVWSEWWNQVNRITRGMAIVFGTLPMACDLIAANRIRFKYDMVWEKNSATGFVNADTRPMRRHENILVFCCGDETYNKQLRESESEMVKSHARRGYSCAVSEPSEHLPGLNKRPNKWNVMINPGSVLRFKSVGNRAHERKHPTQKPVALMRWLVETYSNKGDTILDPYAGSGSTLLAAKEMGRGYIGIELQPEYVAVCKQRLEIEYLGL